MSFTVCYLHCEVKRVITDVTVSSSANKRTQSHNQGQSEITCQPSVRLQL